MADTMAVAMAVDGGKRSLLINYLSAHLSSVRDRELLSQVSTKKEMKKTDFIKKLLITKSRSKVFCNRLHCITYSV